MTALGRNDAVEFATEIEQAWNTRNPSAVIRLLRQDTVWRHNESVAVGLADIWQALKGTWERTLHFTARFAYVSHRADAVEMSHLAEWQDAVHGDWRRTAGEVTAIFDDERRIVTLESNTISRVISASDRRLTLPRATSAAPTGGNP